MQVFVAVILTVFLSWPGILRAADQKPAPAAAMASATLSEKFDINRVSLDELVGVPGIGPRLAQAIVDLRLKKGSIKELAELLEVTGIKEKKLASLGEYLEVKPLQASALSAPAAPQR